MWIIGGVANITKYRPSDGASQGSFPVGNQSQGVAFDGANVWITSYNDSTVTKLRATDGAFQRTFIVGSTPWGIAFDGANMWVANQNINNLSKLPVFP
jgi:hypothetical protein